MEFGLLQKPKTAFGAKVLKYTIERVADERAPA
jgi:hypothetical protein